MNAKPIPPCHVCGKETLVEVAAFARLSRVTSDCRPWPAGGRLGVCASCGTVQKLADEVWTAERDSIYRNYALFHQGDTSDQTVFDAASGHAEPRNEKVLTHLAAAFDLPPSGRLLDVGCGRGAFLSAFAKRFPGWTLVGCDRFDANRTEIESITGVEAFVAGSAADVPGDFDLIAMSHVLEHVPDPVAFLAGLHSKLGEDGRLVVHGPNFPDNSFDLLVADHCTHFVPSSLSAVVEAAGYTVERVSGNWVAKELSLVASTRPAATSATSFRDSDDPQETSRTVAAAVGWLRGVAEAARALTEGGPFGIFGTSIAGVWLDVETGGEATFFCDEDRARAGKPFMGRPVIPPNEVEAPADVYLPMPHAIAERIAQRLTREKIRYHVPPPID